VEAPATTPLKRRYVADSHDVEVVKKIKQNEVELRDRNTVLRGTKANVRTLTRNYLEVNKIN
jgi:parafibromin